MQLLTAYNTKNEAIFDEIISTDYIDHGQTSYMDAPGRGVAGAKNDLKHAIDSFDDLNNVVEATIASEASLSRIFACCDVHICMRAQKRTMLI